MFSRKTETTPAGGGKCVLNAGHGRATHGGLCSSCATTFEKGKAHDGLKADRDALADTVQQQAQQLAEAQAPRLLLPDPKRCITVPDPPDGIIVGPDGRCIHKRASGGDGKHCVFHQGAR